jgi:hypothetical protein
MGVESIRKRGIVAANGSSETVSVRRAVFGRADLPLPRTGQTAASAGDIPVSELDILLRLQRTGGFMHIRKIALYAAVAALALPALAASGPMRAGKWKMSAEMKMEGMDMKMPPMTFERCVTSEEAEQSSTQPPKGKNDTCTITDFKIEGKTATWKEDCSKPKMKGDGKITYSTDSFEEEMNMQMQDPRSDKATNVTQKISGQRIGDCDEKK